MGWGGGGGDGWRQTRNWRQRKQIEIQRRQTVTYTDRLDRQTGGKTQRGGRQ